MWEEVDFGVLCREREEFGMGLPDLKGCVVLFAGQGCGWLLLFYGQGLGSVGIGPIRWSCPFVCRSC